jgi:ribosomal protein S18 acetylase RimI-like enzyme
MKVNLHDAADAFREVSDDITMYYNRMTGEFVPYGDFIDDMDEKEEEDEDEEDLVPLPSRYEINSYHAMELFIDSLDEGQAKEWLANSIRGRGAFRRFRGTCERFGLLDDWYAFEDEYYLNLAREWCDDNNIPYENREVQAEEEEDFNWNDEEQFKPREETEPEVKITKDPYRIIRMNERNMNLLSYLTDAFDRQMDRENEDHTDMMVGEDRFVFAMSDNGRFGAYIYGVFIEGTAVVKELYVRKEYRHQGVGKSLLQRVKEEYPDMAVRLEEENEQMKAFLKACGFGKVKAVEYTDA